jgi:4-aminobutyrate aminotransferase
MIGVEFRTAERQPDRALTKAIVHACQEERLLLLTCGPWDNTIRFIPPLVVTGEQIDHGLAIFANALKKVH